MKVLYDEDNNPIEVPDDDELKVLREKAAKADELEPEVEKLKNDPEKINWRKVREKLKEKGKDINDEGEVIEANQLLTREDINKITEESVRGQLFETEKNKIRLSIPEKDREVFDYYFNKFMSGEDKTIDNLYKFSGEAKNNVYPPSSSNRLDRAISSGLGNYPRGGDNSNNDTAREIARELGHSEKDLSDNSNPVITI